MRVDYDKLEVVLLSTNNMTYERLKEIVSAMKEWEEKWLHKSEIEWPEHNHFTKELVELLLSESNEVGIKFIFERIRNKTIDDCRAAVERST